MEKDILNLFKDYKYNNNIKRLEELYLYFEKTISNLSKSMPYDEGHTDLIIEFIKLINSDKLNNCINSAHLEGAIIIALKYRKLDLIRKNNKKIVECALNDELINEKSFYNNSNLSVYDLFENLTNNQKEIMELSFIYNYSDAEIARLKNKSRQSIGQTKKRSIKILEGLIKM